MLIIYIIIDTEWGQKRKQPNKIWTADVGINILAMTTKYTGNWYNTIAHS